MSTVDRNFKGNVKTPYAMPEHIRNRGNNFSHTVEVPLLIRIFAWYCVVRTVAFIGFGLTVGIAPESAAASFLIANFDGWSKQASPEAVFYIYALFYGFIAFKWFRRSWQARWGTMFVTGATSAKTLINLIAEYAAGNPDNLQPGRAAMIAIGCAFNLMICAYLAFYPGMEQAFSETD